MDLSIIQRDLRDHKNLAVLEAKHVALEKLLDHKFVMAEKALMLQAKEYERRLDALNGEADRLRQMQITYLPREVYESSGLLWKQGFIAIIVGIVVLAATWFVR